MGRSGCGGGGGLSMTVVKRSFRHDPESNVKKADMTALEFHRLSVTDTYDYDSLHDACPFLRIYEYISPTF